MAEVDHGRSVARTRLQRNPTDEDALFFLGKMNLNVIWLHLATLGRRTGWSEYWEARKSLDSVLKANPQHVRARVARAWIDYIVDTKVPRGTRWLLGGGSRKRGLDAVREAAQEASPPYVQAEAMFALWDMEVRERNLADAIVVARALARDFPDNRELTKFLYTYDLQGNPRGSGRLDTDGSLFCVAATDGPAEAGHYASDLRSLTGYGLVRSPRIAGRRCGRTPCRSSCRSRRCIHDEECCPP